MKNITLTALSFLLMALCGCGSSSHSIGNLHEATAGSPGIWMQKDQAVELRSTHKLESICGEIRSNPKSKIMNVRLVERSGATYAYDPAVGKLPQLKLGDVDEGGLFNPTPEFKEQSGDMDMSITIHGEVMHCEYRKGDFTMGMDYLRSSEAEAREYYAAQDACKH